VPSWLQQQQAERPNSELKTLLGEIFTKKMANLLADNWFVSKPMKQYTHGEMAAIAEKLASWKVVPAGTEGYRTAEVTLGGVDTREVSSKTMESLKSPGLYFIGEVLDVTGHLGGFNFQWAWASATRRRSTSDQNQSNPCGSWLASEGRSSNILLTVRSLSLASRAHRVLYQSQRSRCICYRPPLHRRHYWLNLASSPRKALALHVIDFVSSVSASPVGAG
jgi:hypothetical protein